MSAAPMPTPEPEQNDLADLLREIQAARYLSAEECLELGRQIADRLEKADDLGEYEMAREAFRLLREKAPDRERVEAALNDLEERALWRMQGRAGFGGIPIYPELVIVDPGEQEVSAAPLTEGQAAQNSPEENSVDIGSLLDFLKETTTIQPSEALELGTQIAELVEKQGDLRQIEMALEAYRLLREKSAEGERRDWAYLEPSLRSWELRARELGVKLRQAAVPGRLEETRAGQAGVGSRLWKLAGRAVSDRQAQSYLAFARAILELDPEAGEQAEYFLDQAQSRLDEVEKYRQALRAAQVPIFVWNLAWAVLAVAGLMFAPVLAASLAARLGATPDSGQARVIQGLLTAGFFGVLGGVLGNMNKLFRGLAMGEVKPPGVDYYLQPVLGLLSGWLFLLALDGFFLIALPQTYQAQNSPGTELASLIERSASALAFIAGMFLHRWLGVFLVERAAGLRGAPERDRQGGE